AANTNGPFAATRTECEFPGARCKSGKLQTRELGTQILQRAMQPAQLKVPDWIHWNAKPPPRPFGFQSLNREICKPTIWDGCCASTQRRGYNTAGTNRFGLCDRDFLPTGLRSGALGKS